MTPFASVALFKRDGKLTFKAPRKEPHDTVTQARKSASRYWNGNIAAPDKLMKIILVQVTGPVATIHERAVNSGHDHPWLREGLQLASAAIQPHLAACLNELGVDATKAPTPLPDILEVNGVIYRRDL